MSSVDQLSTMIGGLNNTQRDQFNEWLKQSGLGDAYNMSGAGVRGPAGAVRSVDAMASNNARFGFGTAPTPDTQGAAVTTPLSARVRPQTVRVNGTVVPDSANHVKLDSEDDLTPLAGGAPTRFSALHTQLTNEEGVNVAAVGSPGIPDNNARNRIIAGKVDDRLEREYGVHPIVDAAGQRTGAMDYAMNTVDPRSPTGASRLSAPSAALIQNLQTGGANPGAAATIGLRNADTTGILGGMLSGGALTGGALGIGSLSMSSVALGAAEGMMFQMRKQMRATASNFGDYSMISMINSPGIPIESLIYYFMAYMADKYEDKLREKMEEVVIQEQRERRMEQRRQAADLIGGIGGVMLGGVGPLAALNPMSQLPSLIAKAGAETMNSMEASLSGSSKSTTVLMQEVQILVQNWKMIMDMTSNLSKTLHEMAMTAVRNIR